MNIGDLQDFLRKLGALLAANQGGKPAAEFEAFCAGLEPFREQAVGLFAQFLRDAAEYQRTGVVPLPAGKKERGAKGTATKSGAGKTALKKKDDVKAVEAAAATLRQLHDRATDPALTHEVIEAEVDRIDRAFDMEGLKAVARKFGVTSGLSSKAAARTKILNRIAERKGRHERGEAIAEVAKSATLPHAAPVVAEEADVVVEEMVPASGTPTSGSGPIR